MEGYNPQDFSFLTAVRISTTVAACASIVKMRQWIAFMFGLLETCKLNDIDFGIYIEDVLTRIMYGEQVDDTFLPCGYVPRYKEGQDAA